MFSPSSTRPQSIHTAVDLLKSRRTKIMATLGPASSDEEVIGRLIKAGVNLFRLNMSHGNQQSHGETYERIRRAAHRRGEAVAILADLGGPKIRTGLFNGGSIELTEGERVTVTTRDVMGEPGLIPSQYKALGTDVHVGDRILLDDGQLELKVESIEDTEIRAVVRQGGTLSDKKGMNLPGVLLSVPSISEKDKADARFAVELGVDLLALSFVRRAADVVALRDLLEGSGQDTAIISKIEKGEALADIANILDASDGIMVARGDLGVELPPEMVPVAQGQLIDRARRSNKPVIVATQMLDSMTRNRRPTRAEVSDVSNAVMAGADVLMLSAETAVGAHPVVTVETLDRIIRHTEGYQWAQGAFEGTKVASDLEPPLPVWAAMGLATAQLSRDLRVRCILVASRSGTTARMVAAARPAAPVIAVSSNPRTCRRMNLLWGVIPVKVEADEMDKPLNLGRRLAADLGLADPGHTILVVRGYHELPALNQPTLTVLTL